MNIGSAASYPAFPSIGYAISVSDSGRMSVPVAPSAYIYSHFKHVSGVPATDGESGVSINRLKIIDTLIEQISRMKQEPDPMVNMQEMDLEMENEARINAMIEQYHSQFQNIQAANANNPYAPASPLTGMVFNISV